MNAARAGGLGRLAALGRGLHWYLRELTGENAYGHYLEVHARHRADHPEHAHRPPLSRAEFEDRRRRAREEGMGSARCC